MKQKLVLIGNGMAGARTLEELLKLAADKYDITVFGAEPHGNYNRILLSPVLAGEKTIDEIMLNPKSWYQQHGIQLFSGDPVTHIDRAQRMVVTANGTRCRYDRLIIATGSSPFMLPLPGNELEGIIGFRDINDVETMLDSARHYSSAMVIGGGLLGLEAANGLMKQGMQVQVVHLLDTLMEQQLDGAAATLLQSALEQKGMKFQMGRQTAAFHGDGRVQQVEFSDGSLVDADLVVMAVGVRPNIELARESRLHCERGIVVSDTLQTYDPNIYAVGECIQHRGQTFGLVAPLFEQARVCANHLAEIGSMRYQTAALSTKLKVTGIDLFSAGEIHAGEDCESMVFNDASRGIYKKLVIRDQRIAGTVLYGDTIDGSWYFQMMRDQTDISEMREDLLFGQAHMGNAGHGAIEQVTELPGDAEICGCNGVSKDDITNAISRDGLFTLDEVRACTRASSSCGSCTGLVEQLLSATLGSDCSISSGRQGMCACTSLTHEDVRTAIQRHELKSIPALIRGLGWKSAEGCHKCRPALNYYLLCQWPGEYQDDHQSRFVNERVHANIQKDGSYSVVPRLWGGTTTPAELRAIADAAEKFNVPVVKLTGGQRIDLLGVSKSDLPAIWADLNRAGLISGHAYGKSVRTVKTCVGNQWCRFGYQEAMGIGRSLEKLTWGAWTPHKFKAAVSGCPRNCAEATIKDFGVVGVESGWELHIGGNGGVKIRATEFLCKVRNSEQVMEYCAAYLQLYREEARYRERTAAWIERMGMGFVRKRIVEDDAGRRALSERFLYAQQFFQTDPWEENMDSSGGYEYNALEYSDTQLPGSTDVG